ncbi:hypothetical protein H4R24_000594 [Coemansia sp. RSA 988]|nr:hypothetical protein H4R24_000594 [Coemansia sp. RSA 988]
MSVPSRINSIREQVIKYEHQSVATYLPLGQHASWQLLPIIGNIVVFVQSSILIRRINKVVHIPLHQRVETWISVYILLFIGMVPILGLALTIYCTHCSDHLGIAILQLREQGPLEQSPGDIESSIGEAAGGAQNNLIVSSIDRPESTRSTSSKHSKKSVKRHDSVKSSRSLKSLKSLKLIKEEKANPSDNEKAAQGKPAEFKRKHSVFDRVSRMPWMDEIMALSPTNSNRTSLSTTVAVSRPETRYENLHDLATRNSKIPSSSLDDLSTLAVEHQMSYSNDDLQLGYKAKRVTHSVHIDDLELEKSATMSKALDLLKRPNYSNKTAHPLRRKSSSLVGLAPSPHVV